MRIPVVYSDDQTANDTDLWSPSAEKPLHLARTLISGNFPIKIVSPRPVSRETLYLAHDKKFVDDILDGVAQNGFGTISSTVASSLPYTTGAMVEAAAYATCEVPSAALVSGFHHAGYATAQMFCTFNGLMVCAIDLLRHQGKRVAILDADYHYGNGTEDILGRLGLYDKIWHYSFGKYYRSPDQADDYLRKIGDLRTSLRRFNPGIILYQAGADVHVNDPLGGLFTDEQIFQRDFLVFELAKELHVPICWNLAGGYQRDERSSIDPVLRIHLNTFLAAQRVYGIPGDDAT